MICRFLSGAVETLFSGYLYVRIARLTCGINTFLDWKTTIFQLGAALYRSKTNKESLNMAEGPNTFDQLVEAAREGDKEGVARILAEHPDWVDGKSSKEETALHVASYEGHLDVVSYLIESSTSLETRDHIGQTALLLAVDGEKEEIVKFLLERKADVNTANDEKWTALHIAAYEGNEECARILINHGAGVDSQEEQGCTPLWLACREGHIELVRLLVESQAQVELKDNSGVRPLVIAVNYDRQEVVKYLLEKSSPVTSSNEKMSPLHVAALQGHVTCARYLIDHGANVDIQTNDGYTSLLLASEEGHAEMVRLLVDCKAQLEVKDDDGDTPLAIAVENDEEDVVKYLLERNALVNTTNKERMTPLHVAAFEDHVTCARYLIRHGANVDSQNEDGYTPLHLACEESHLELVRLLVDSQAMVEMKDNNGITALSTAVWKDNRKIVKYLLERKARVDTIDNIDGWTPLHRAAFKGHVTCARCLINAGADIDIQTQRGSTALYLSSQEGRVALARLLLESNAEMEIQNMNGQTALAIAVWRDKEEIVKLLLDGNAQLNATDRTKWAPLHAAAFKGHVTCARHLISRGANVDCQTDQGATPLGLASQQGNLELVKLLVEAEAGIEIKDQEGDTPLQLAIWNDSQNVVKYLLEKKTCTDTKNSKDWSPLHSAALQGHLTCVRYLLDNGADVNIVAKSEKTCDDQYEWTALHVAIIQGFTSIVELLISRGADLDAPNHKGQTSLHLAVGCRYRKSRRVQDTDALLRIQKRVTDASKLEEPFSQADALICLLIEAGANITITDNRGMTPLQYLDDGMRNTVLSITRDTTKSVDEDSLQTAIRTSFDTESDYSDYFECTCLLADFCKPVINDVTNGKDDVMEPYIESDDDSTTDMYRANRTKTRVPILAAKSNEKEIVQPMSDDERKELALNINKLSDDQLERVLHIINSKEPCVKDPTQEVLDIEFESLNTSTLREIEKYVMSCLGQIGDGSAPEDDSSGSDSEEEQDSDQYFCAVLEVDASEILVADLIAEGAFGSVHKGVWRKTPVAVRRLLSPADDTTDVHKELRVHERAMHPNVVTVKATACTKDETLIVMEHVDGFTLRDVIFSSPKMIHLSMVEKIRISSDILTALTFLHASEIVHLDVKPSNIMVARQSRKAYVCDLGLAEIKRNYNNSSSSPSSSRTPSLQDTNRTLAYMAPELLSEDTHYHGIPANDVWSAAATLLELFTEKHLWLQLVSNTQLVEILSGPDVRPPLLEEVKPEVSALLAPCFRKDPTLRPSCETLLDRFHGLSRKISMLVSQLRISN